MDINSITKKVIKIFFLSLMSKRKWPERGVLRIIDKGDKVKIIQMFSLEWEVLQETDDYLLVTKVMEVKPRPEGRLVKNSI